MDKQYKILMITLTLSAIFLLISLLFVLKELREMTSYNSVLISQTREATEFIRSYCLE